MQRLGKPCAPFAFMVDDDKSERYAILRPLVRRVVGTGADGQPLQSEAAMRVALTTLVAELQREEPVAIPPMPTSDTPLDPPGCQGDTKRAAEAAASLAALAGHELPPAERSPVRTQLKSPLTTGRAKAPGSSGGVEAAVAAELTERQRQLDAAERAAEWPELAAAGLPPVEPEPNAMQESIAMLQQGWFYHSFFALVKLTNA